MRFCQTEVHPVRWETSRSRDIALLLGFLLVSTVDGSNKDWNKGLFSLAFSSLGKNASPFTGQCTSCLNPSWDDNWILCFPGKVRFTHLVDLLGSPLGLLLFLLLFKDGNVSWKIAQNAIINYLHCFCVNFSLAFAKRQEDVLPNIWPPISPMRKEIEFWIKSNMRYVSEKLILLWAYMSEWCGFIF